MVGLRKTEERGQKPEIRIQMSEARKVVNAKKVRKVIGSEKSDELREPAASYGVNIIPENNHLSIQNGYLTLNFNRIAWYDHGTAQF